MKALVVALMSLFLLIVKPFHLFNTQVGDSANLSDSHVFLALQCWVLQWMIAEIFFSD